MIYLVMLIILSSCSPYLINSMGYEILEDDLDTVWAETIMFKYVWENDDYVKSPVEFVSSGGGDCEDFAVYMVYRLGRDASLVAIRVGFFNHGIVHYRGMYIEPQVYGKFYNKAEIEILETYSYDYIMRYATRWGTKALYL